MVSNLGILLDSLILLEEHVAAVAKEASVGYISCTLS